MIETKDQGHRSASSPHLVQRTVKKQHSQTDQNEGKTG